MVTARLWPRKTSSRRQVFNTELKTRKMNTMQKLDYVLGHSQREILRLISQAAMLRPVTERLLRSVKIGPGTRVLDLGCGAGDVSMLAAEFVGPTGAVPDFCGSLHADWRVVLLTGAEK
jgi:16S rRNA G1207 methylase RsmC